MSTWVVQVAIVALFALICGALAAAWMRGRLVVAAIVLFSSPSLRGSLRLPRSRRTFHDANEFATCDASAAPIHYLSAIAFIAPPLLISLAALAMLVSRGAVGARRRTAHENHG